MQQGMARGPMQNNAQQQPNQAQQQFDDVTSYDFLS
jgi:hypothetical protein